MGKAKLIGLGSKFRAARKAKGLTQEELAHSINRDHPSISRLENGRTNPTYLFLLDICEALDLKLVEVLGYTEEE